MAIRLSGLTSGLDTDSIVQELVSAYSQKTQKYEKAQTKLTWKQDIWKNLNTKIYSLYTNVSNLRYSNAYTLRKTTVSDNTKATVTASSTAVTGTQTLKINKTAQASYMTGDKIGTDVKSDTKMSELGYSGSKTSITVEKKDGSTHEISISKSTTVQEVVNQFKEAGLNASFDEHNQRFFISAKDSGEANDFNIYADYSNLNSKNALSALGLNTALTMKDQNNKTVFTEAGAAKYQDAYDVYKAAAGITDEMDDEQKAAALKALADKDDKGQAILEEYIRSQVDDYNDLKSDYTMAKNLANKYQEVMNSYDALEERYNVRSDFEEIKAAVERAGVKVADIGATDISGLQPPAITEQTLRSMITRFNGTDATLSAVKSAVGGSINEGVARQLVSIFNADSYSTKMENIAEYTGSDLLTTSAADLEKERDSFAKNSDASAMLDERIKALTALEGLQITLKNAVSAPATKTFLTSSSNVEDLLRQVYSIQASDMKLTAEEESDALATVDEAAIEAGIDPSIDEADREAAKAEAVKKAQEAAITKAKEEKRDTKRIALIQSTLEQAGVDSENAAADATAIYGVFSSDKTDTNLENALISVVSSGSAAKTYLSNSTNAEALMDEFYGLASTVTLTQAEIEAIEQDSRYTTDEERAEAKANELAKKLEEKRKKAIENKISGILNTDRDAIYNTLSSTTKSSNLTNVYMYQYGDLLDGLGTSGIDGLKQDLITKKTDLSMDSIEADLIAAKQKVNDLSAQMQENKFAYIIEDATDKNADKTISEKIEEGVKKLAGKAIEANEVFNDLKSEEGNASKIGGSDAEIELNGVKYTNSSNSFSINGLTIDALATTTEAVTITTSVDTQGIYDKIKDFLTEYNTVINEMCKLYNAESASDYEPLTDEEKEAMSDEQIEKWETKIKDSLLRRDNSLSSIMNGMVNAMAQTYNVNGTKLSLSSFGISTLGFLNAAENEHYAYHIDGDEDDDNTSEKDDKLMTAIQEDPDTVLEFMKQLTSGLYNTINDKMKSTELSSAYKVYNDKEMDDELADYADLIEKWEEKVKDKEDYYYDKFSQMEVALSKLQNQTSSISSLLGS